MTRTHLDIPALQARDLPRLDWTALFHENADAPLTDTDRSAMTDYFSKFLPPHEKFHCVGCDSVLTGGLVGFLMGATFTWGIANGEGFCCECGYPARAYHRNVGPVEFLDMVLQYHPSGLVPPERELTGEQAASALGAFVAQKGGGECTK
jgi:hypothetical protein